MPCQRSAPAYPILPWWDHAPRCFASAQRRAPPSWPYQSPLHSTASIIVAALVLRPVTAPLVTGGVALRGGVQAAGVHRK